MLGHLVNRMSVGGPSRVGRY